MKLLGFTEPAGAQCDHPTIFLLEGCPGDLVGGRAVHVFRQLHMQRIAVFRGGVRQRQRVGDVRQAGGGGVGVGAGHDENSDWARTSF